VQNNPALVSLETLQDILLQVLHCLFEHCPEPVDVDPDVLLAEVPLGHVPPAAEVHGDGVPDDGVVLAEHVHQRALLRGDGVLEVAEAHVAGRVAEVDARDVVELPVRHDLQEHGARGEVDAVGEAGPVHADHGVEGVDLPRERVVARPRAAGDRDVEPGRLSGGDDLREVEEPPAVGPLQDHHPGGGGAGSTPASETR
jgi:hypothetical protein